MVVYLFIPPPIMWDVLQSPFMVFISRAYICRNDKGEDLDLSLTMINKFHDKLTNKVVKITI